MFSQVSLSLFLVQVSPLPMRFDRFGLTKLIGEEHIYNSLPDVLEAYRKETKQVEAEPGS